MGELCFDTAACPYKQLPVGLGHSGDCWCSIYDPRMQESPIGQTIKKKHAQIYFDGLGVKPNTGLSFNLGVLLSRMRRCYPAPPPFGSRYLTSKPLGMFLEHLHFI